MSRGQPVETDLDSWVICIGPRAVAYARSLLPTPDLAEDVVQDCFCRLIAKADVYDLPTDGTKLLFRSITNACINLKTRRRPIFSLFRGGPNADDERSEDPVDRKTSRPDDVAAGNELQTAVAAALAQLPVQQRAAVELKSLGHTQSEIAEILDTTPTNAGVLVHRARLALAQTLAPFLDGENAT